MDKIYNCRPIIIKFYMHIGHHNRSYFAKFQHNYQSTKNFIAKNYSVPNIKKSGFTKKNHLWFIGRWWSSRTTLCYLKYFMYTFFLQEASTSGTSKKGRRWWSSYQSDLCGCSVQCINVGILCLISLSGGEDFKQTRGSNATNTSACGCLVWLLLIHQHLVVAVTVEYQLTMELTAGVIISCQPNYVLCCVWLLNDKNRKVDEAYMIILVIHVTNSSYSVYSLPNIMYL